MNDDEGDHYGHSRTQARLRDSQDPLSPFRYQFAIPSNAAINATAVPPSQAHASCVYLCGNSLGLMNSKSKARLEEEVARWATLGVDGHFTPRDSGWITQTDRIHPLLAPIIGAKESEIACMGSLTANLHLLMNAFYQPTSSRYKILCESRAFPSDQYAFASQALQHGLDPKDAIFELEPRTGEASLREEDILATIDQHGDSIAVVLFSGVQYYTGQWFPIESITRAAQSKGCICGWDLAHAVGNVPLSLHDWNVDFAVWCSYKYLNAGPGAIAGLFIHERWDSCQPARNTGWWGHVLDTRFHMPREFTPIQGAQGWQQSNPSVFASATLQGSLEVYQEAGGVSRLREKSVQLTAYLEDLLRASRYYLPNSEFDAIGYTVLTPSDPNSRGCQLSVKIYGGLMGKVFDEMKRRGVVGDERRPDVIRLSPTPLYNTFEDCWIAARILDQVLDIIIIKP